MKRKSIRVDLAVGIKQAIEIHTPHLLPILEKLETEAEFEEPKLIPGQSIHGKLFWDIPESDGAAILEALEAIEKKVGYSTMFKGGQINLLVCEWRHFVKSEA